MELQNADLLKHHPLQRMKSPSQGVSAVLHILGLASFLKSFKYLYDNPNAITLIIFSNASWGWHLQYLTIIGLLFATITFTLGFVADLTMSRRIFVAKNALSVATAPLEVLISILYWTIQVIDPRLIVPDSLPLLPRHADFGFHAAPALLLTIDLLFFSPPWTIAVLPAFGLSGIIAAVYWFWVEACYAHNGFYPYPLFDIATLPRVGIFVGAATVMSFSTYCLKRLYTAVNGKPIQSGTAHSKPGSIKKS